MNKITYDISSENDGDSINIVPMIDVIFAILTFFIIASLDLIKIDIIDVNLPKASTSKIVEDKPLILSIDKSNNMFLGNKQISNKNNIVDQIRNFISASTKNILVISADKDVSYGQVVEVLDQLRTIDNLTIGISTDNQPFVE
tara:strand:- start:12 stop:440 length:429 start_codon:yes stop_codon:yes gene_type:complete